MNVLSNLNGLIRCPFQVIFDIALHMNTNKAAFSELLLKPLRPLETISDWVHLDSLGCPVALRAYEASHLLSLDLAQEGIYSLDLDVYLGDDTLDIDNYYAIVLLSRLMRGALHVSFYVDDKEALTQYVHDSRTNEQLHMTIHSSTRLLESSAYLLQLNDLKAARYAVLQAAGFHFFSPESDRIKAFDFNSGFIRYVWMGLKTGAYPVSTRLLEYVLNTHPLSEQEHESLLMHLQHIHFLSHQHDVVVNQKYPHQFKYQLPEIVINLYFIKAFSATLTRQFEVAKECFNLAGIDASMPVDDENSLYQLNLLALYHLLKGEMALAFDLERRLNEYLETNKVSSVAMNYVVLINIARLYKKSQDFDQSFYFYEKAYKHIRAGGFTTFDSMYYNMDKAGIYESSGNRHKALTSWIKVALYWLSCANPFSLALKPRVVLCQEKVTDTLAPLNREKVNQFLFKKISLLSEQLGYEFDVSTPNQLHFISSDIKHTKNTAYINNDLIIYGCSVSRGEKIHPITQTEEHLHQLLSFLIHAHAKLNLHEGALIIEASHEQMEYSSVDDCFCVAAMQGCSHYYWNDTRYSRDSEEVQERLSEIELMSHT